MQIGFDSAFKGLNALGAEKMAMIGMTVITLHSDVAQSV
jgi:hypothetical protein